MGEDLKEACEGHKACWMCLGVWVEEYLEKSTCSTIGSVWTQGGDWLPLGERKEHWKILPLRPLHTGST